MVRPPWIALSVLLTTQALLRQFLVSDLAPMVIDGCCFVAVQFGLGVVPVDIVLRAQRLTKLSDHLEAELGRFYDVQTLELLVHRKVCFPFLEAGRFTVLN